MSSPLVTNVVDPKEEVDAHRATRGQMRDMMDDWFEVKRPVPPGPQPDIHARPPEAPAETKPETKGATAPPAEAPPEPPPKAPEPKPEETPPPAPETTRPGMPPAAPPPRTVPVGEEDTGDEEVDKFRLRANASHQSRSQFHELKQITKARGDQLRELQSRLDAQTQELAQLKAAGPGAAAGVDPAVQERLKRADEVLRTLDIQNWPQYQEKYVKPINAKWQQVVTLVGDSLGAQTKPEIKKWAEDLLAMGPDALSKDWWKQQLEQLPDSDDRDEARSILREIQGLRRERDRFAQENSGPEKFQALVNQQGQELGEQWKREVEKSAFELGKELELGDWSRAIPVPPDTPPDKIPEATLSHNKRFEGYQREFVNMMVAIAGGEKGEAPLPVLAKDRTRVCMMAVTSIHQKAEIANLNKTIKELEGKNKALEAQLNKTVKARSAPEARGAAPTPKIDRPPNGNLRPGTTSAQRTKEAMDTFFER